MDKTSAMNQALKIVEKSKVATLGTLGEEGYPTIKAMLKISTDGLNTIWFSTNTSSKKVKRILADKRGGVYFFDSNTFEGLMLTGDLEVLQDAETKKRFWVEGFEMYYPKGVEDPDYSVLKFTTKKANLYSNLNDVVFDI